jgi:hypothetical protein
MRLGWGPATGGGAALLQLQVVGRRWARTGDGGVRHQRSGWMSRVTEGGSRKEDVAEGGNQEEDVSHKEYVIVCSSYHVTGHTRWGYFYLPSEAPWIKQLIRNVLWQQCIRGSVCFFFFP